MVFSSVIFIFCFLPFVLSLYYTIGQINIHLKNTLLLVASLIFYAWGEPKNVILLISSCLCNYILGRLIHTLRNQSKLKFFLLLLSILFNFGLLFVFKYYNFAIESMNALFSINVLSYSNLIVPIGISFFTLQAMSYIFDVYQEKVEVQKNPFTLALYISLFPQVAAGPIIRYNTIHEQLYQRKETMEKFSKGVCRFISGLAKKVILANAFVIIADNVYGLTQLWHTQYLVPATLAWLGAFAFSLQIYINLSAYSDMAIGLGKMFGFDYEENFNYPYISKSLNEFWKRWNISLTTWFRDYLFLSLGGSNVVNKDQFVRNLAIVWLAIGIWHGADWTFILWGIWNFIFILLEHFINIDEIKCSAIYKHIYTLMIVNFGWVIFRAENIHKLIEYVRNMFCLNNNGVFSSITWMFIKENIVMIIMGIIVCIPPIFWKSKFKPLSESKLFEYGYPFVMISLFLLSVIYLIRGGNNSFYYQF